MHEIGVADSIIKSVLEAAENNNAKVINEVGVAIGVLSGVEPRSLEFALDVVKKGTMAENAVFKVEVIKAVGVCIKCGKESVPDTFFSICTHCDFPTLEITAGNELDVTYVDID